MNDEIEIIEPAITVKINRSYRNGISSAELYEITRGIWKINDKEKREKAEYVFAIYYGRIIEVYEVEQWYKANSTPYQFRKHDPAVAKSRYEFVGQVASDGIRSKYVGKNIARTYQTINYYNC
jgi:hypothetical protein